MTYMPPRSRYLDNRILESNHVWDRYASQSQGENVQDRVYLYNQHSFVCVGANRAPGYLLQAMNVS